MKKKLLNQLMRAAYGLGVVFLLAGMLLSAVNVPAMAQEETPAVPTEEITEEVVVTEEAIPTEAVELTFEGPVETEPTEEPTEEPIEEPTEEPAAVTLDCVFTSEDGILMAGLSDGNALLIVDGYVQGTDIAVGADAPLCEEAVEEEIIDSAMASTISNFMIDCSGSSIQFNGDTYYYGQVEAKFFMDGSQLGATQTASWSRNGNGTFTFYSAVMGDGDYYWQIRYRQRRYNNQNWGSWQTITSDTENLVCTPVPDPPTVSDSITCDGALLTINNPVTGANVTVSYSLRIRNGRRWDLVPGTEVNNLSLAPGSSEVASYNNLDLTKRYRWIWSIDGENNEGTDVDMSDLDCWDKSSLSFTAGCTGDCESITATVCNLGTGNMAGTSTWYLWYAETGNPKDGSQVESGTIPALESESCYDITMAPTNGDGNYMFSADQRPYHPGTGELWSGQCEITCSVPEVPTLDVTGTCETNPAPGHQDEIYKYTVTYSGLPSFTFFYVVEGYTWFYLGMDIGSGYSFYTDDPTVHVLARHFDWSDFTWEYYEADGEASCITPDPDVIVTGECNEDAGQDETYKYEISFSNVQSGSYLYAGETQLAGPVEGSMTDPFTLYSDDSPVTIYVMNQNCSPSQAGVGLCEIAASSTSDTLFCTNPDLVSASGTCGWNLDPAVSDYPFAFTYTVEYVDMPDDGLLTLEYGSPYPTQSVSGSGTATFTVYAAAAPVEAVNISASGTGVATAPEPAALSNTCPTASIAIGVTGCDASNPAGSDYLYDYTITPTGVPNGATIEYDTVSITYAGEASVAVDNYTAGPLNAVVNYKGLQIASASASANDAAMLELCQPGIDVTAVSCTNVLNTSASPYQYTFNVDLINLVGGSVSLTPDDGAAHSVADGDFEVVQPASAGNSLAATWSRSTSITDTASAVEMTCSTPTLTVNSTACILEDGGASLLYTFTVEYSGYASGDKFFVGDDEVGAAIEGGAGSFTFNSNDETVTVVSALGNVTAERDPLLCPVPGLDISGVCVANEAGNGYEYDFTTTYNDLVVGSSIAYTSNGEDMGSYTIPDDGDDDPPADGEHERNGLTVNTLTATWVPLVEEATRETHPTASDTATVDPLSCPVLDLTLEPIACSADPTGGHLEIIWVVGNPGIHEVSYDWYTNEMPGTEFGSGTVAPGETDIFVTDKLTTTSAPIVWPTSAPDDEAPTVHELKVDSFLECPPDVKDLMFADPYCSLNTQDEWQETWKIQNPNEWEMEVFYQVNNGAVQGPFIIPGNGELSFALPLGGNTVKVLWDSGDDSASAFEYLNYDMCEDTPYYDPPVIPYQPIIPVTGDEPVLEAPAAGGELLIPVTGADMSAPLVNTGFFHSLYTYMGLLFLGIGMVLQGVKSRMPK